jgi:TonB family protein
VAAAAALLTAVLLPVAALRGAQNGPLPLTGVVYDQSGGVLPGVQLTLQDAQEFQWEATTDGSGRFEFPPVQPGRYQLRAQIPGFRLLSQDLTLKHAGDWDRAVTLQVGDLQETIHVQAQRAAGVRPAPETPRRVRVGGNIRAPMKVRNVKPVYPESMREAGRDGIVSLEAIIDVDGNVASLRVLGAQVHPDLAAAAMEAVRQWKFTPTLLNGAPVEVKMTVTVNFSLAD